MTDKEKLEKLKKLADAMYYAAQYLTTDASRLHKAMDEYQKFIIHDYKEKSISEGLEKAAKYELNTKATLDEYAYQVAYDLSNDWLKDNPTWKDVETAVKLGANWQKLYDMGLTEKAEMKNVSELFNSETDELKKYATEIAFMMLPATCTQSYHDINRVRIIDAVIYGANWQKEQFEKNRLKYCNSITNEQAELEQGFIDQHLDKYNRMPTFLDAIEYGMKLKEQQLMAKAIDGDITFDYYGDDDKIYGCIAHNSFCLEDFGLEDRDKVKVIVIKE